MASHVRSTSVQSPLACIAGRAKHRIDDGTTPFLTCLILLVSVSLQTVHAQDLSDIRVAVSVQKNAVVLPGIEASYADEGFLNGRTRFSVAVFTSRLGSAFGSRGLLEDRILLGAGWFFRPDKRVNPYVEIETGYSRFDREDGELFALLDNDAMIFSVLAGMEIHAFDSRFSVVADAGYSILHSSAVYPFVASLGIQYSFSR